MRVAGEAAEQWYGTTLSSGGRVYSRVALVDPYGSVTVRSAARAQGSCGQWRAPSQESQSKLTSNSPVNIEFDLFEPDRRGYGVKHDDSGPVCRTRVGTNTPVRGRSTAALCPAVCVPRRADHVNR